MLNLKKMINSYYCHGDENIKKYCHENSLSKIKDSLEFIEKTL